MDKERHLLRCDQSVCILQFVACLTSASRLPYVNYSLRYTHLKKGSFANPLLKKGKTEVNKITFIWNQTQNTYTQTWKPFPSNDSFQNTVYPLVMGKVSILIDIFQYRCASILFSGINIYIDTNNCIFFPQFLTSFSKKWCKNSTKFP